MPQYRKLFNNKKLRAAWDKERKTWWVSVIDVIAALRDTDYDTARNYWKQVKCRMKEASGETFVSRQLKLICKDGKQRYTDVMRYNEIIQLIQKLPTSLTQAAKGLVNFKKFIAKLAADTKVMTAVFDEVCTKGYFDKPLFLQTTEVRTENL